MTVVVILLALVWFGVGFYFGKLYAESLRRDDDLPPTGERF